MVIQEVQRESSLPGPSGPYLLQIFRTNSRQLATHLETILARLRRSLGGEATMTFTGRIGELLKLVKHMYNELEHASSACALIHSQSTSTSLVRCALPGTCICCNQNRPHRRVHLHCHGSTSHTTCRCGCARRQLANTTSKHIFPRCSDAAKPELGW